MKRYFAIGLGLSLAQTFAMAVMTVIAPISTKLMYASDETQLRERLMEQAPKSLERVTQKYKVFQANIAAERFIEGKNVRIQQNMIFKRNDQRIVLEMKDEKAGSRVFGVNPNYAFQLKEAQNTESDLKWTIVDAGPNYADSTSLFNRIDGMSYGVFSSPTHLSGIALYRVLRSKGFNLQHIEETSGPDNQKAIRIIFEYAPAATDTLTDDSMLDASFAGPPSIAGQATLLPDLDWLVYESDLKSTYDLVGKGKSKPVHTITKIDYALASGTETTTCFPSRLSQTITNPNNQVSAKIDCKVEQLTTDTMPDSEFMLGAYGLPELRLAASSTPVGWYVLLLANVCIAMAAVLWWVNSRRAVVGLQR